MKKIIPFIIAGCMLIALCACGTPKEQNTADQTADTQTGQTAEVPAEQSAESAEGQQSVGLPNPITEYDSLEELNETFGVRLAKPGVMGVEDRYYSAIDCEDYDIAQYCFTVNGMEYLLRCAGTTDDISGVWTDAGTAFAGVEGDAVCYLPDCKLARWFTIDGQYCLSVSDGGEMDEETFSLIAEEIQGLTMPGNTASETTAMYDTYAGEYADSFSQRAMLSAESTEDGLQILVSWGGSAFETVTWTMTAKLYEDGLFSYNNCVKENHIFAEDGTETVVVEYENGCGCFSPVDGTKLEWTGAEEEDCRDCVFEKME